MAMLAEPRRKQKVINLRAKNNAWSNDSTKFGQRMLERMGWTSGKGLGANENGITEHVVARYKNDEKGLGFEDKNDQWTKHEDDFNALLANLSNAGNTTENLHSGISLEDKSKKSKARIHYHKFTRGKDISRYSEKDLANIFGKKSFKDVTEVTEEPLKEDIKMTEQVFTEKGSMEDYFKNKLSAFKLKSKGNMQENEDDGYDPGYTFRGFSQESDMNNTFNGLGFESQDDNCMGETCNDELGSENVRMKKKKSKDKVYPTQDNQKNCEEINECLSKKKLKLQGENCEDVVSNNKCDLENIKKKKKKSKSTEHPENCEQIDQILSKSKKEKLKNNKSNDMAAGTLNEVSVDYPTDDTTSKKKKSKKKQMEPSNGEIAICDIEAEEKVNKKKKKSNNKEYIEAEGRTENQENGDFPKRKSEGVVDTQVPKKKKKKKNEKD